MKTLALYAYSVYNESTSKAKARRCLDSAGMDGDKDANHYE